MKLAVMKVEGGFGVLNGDEILAKFPLVDDARDWAMATCAELLGEGRPVDWTDLTAE